MESVARLGGVPGRRRWRWKGGGGGGRAAAAVAERQLGRVCPSSEGASGRSAGWHVASLLGTGHRAGATSAQRGGHHAERRGRTVGQATNYTWRRQKGASRPVSRPEAELVRLS